MPAHSYFATGILVESNSAEPIRKERIWSGSRISKLIITRYKFAKSF